MQARFERARDQLETLLGAGEINKLDAQLCALVRKNELDAGMFYVLSRNMADAKAAEDEETLRILTHVHTPGRRSSRRRPSRRSRCCTSSREAGGADPRQHPAPQPGAAAAPPSTA